MTWRSFVELHAAAGGSQFQHLFGRRALRSPDHVRSSPRRVILRACACLRCPSRSRMQQLSVGTPSFRALVARHRRRCAAVSSRARRLEGGTLPRPLLLLVPPRPPTIGHGPRLEGQQWQGRQQALLRYQRRRLVRRFLGTAGAYRGGGAESSRPPPQPVREGSSELCRAQRIESLVEASRGPTQPFNATWAQRSLLDSAVWPCNGRTQSRNATCAM